MMSWCWWLIVLTYVTDAVTEESDLSEAGKLLSELQNMLLQRILDNAVTDLLDSFANPDDPPSDYGFLEVPSTTLDFGLVDFNTPGISYFETIEPTTDSVSEFSLSTVSKEGSYQSDSSETQTGDSRLWWWDSESTVLPPSSTDMDNYISEEATDTQLTADSLLQGTELTLSGLWLTTNTDGFFTDRIDQTTWPGESMLPGEPSTSMSVCENESCLEDSDSEDLLTTALNVTEDNALEDAENGSTTSESGGEDVITFASSISEEASLESTDNEGTELVADWEEATTTLKDSEDVSLDASSEASAESLSTMVPDGGEDSSIEGSTTYGQERTTTDRDVSEQLTEPTSFTTYGQEQTATDQDVSEQLSEPTSLTMFADHVSEANEEGVTERYLSSMFTEGEQAAYSDEATPFTMLGLLEDLATTYTEYLPETVDRTSTTYTELVSESGEEAPDADVSTAYSEAQEDSTSEGSTVLTEAADGLLTTLTEQGEQVTYDGSTSFIDEPNEISTFTESLEEALSDGSTAFTEIPSGDPTTLHEVGDQVTSDGSTGFTEAVDELTSFTESVEETPCDESTSDSLSTFSEPADGESFDGSAPLTETSDELTTFSEALEEAVSNESSMFTELEDVESGGLTTFHEALDQASSDGLTMLAETTDELNTFSEALEEAVSDQSTVFTELEEVESSGLATFHEALDQASSDGLTTFPETTDELNTFSEALEEAVSDEPTAFSESTSSMADQAVSSEQSEFMTTFVSDFGDSSSVDVLEGLGSTEWGTELTTMELTQSEQSGAECQLTTAEDDLDVTTDSYESTDNQIEATFAECSGEEVTSTLPGLPDTTVSDELESSSAAETDGTNIGTTDTGTTFGDEQLLTQLEGWSSSYSFSEILTEFTLSEDTSDVADLLTTSFERSSAEHNEFFSTTDEGFLTTQYAEVEETRTQTEPIDTELVAMSSSAEVSYWETLAATESSEVTSAASFVQSEWEEVIDLTWSTEYTEEVVSTTVETPETTRGTQSYLDWIPLKKMKELSPLEALVQEPDVSQIGRAILASDKYEAMKKVGMTIFVPVDSAFHGMPLDIGTVASQRRLRKSANYPASKGRQLSGRGKNRWVAGPRVRPLNCTSNPTECEGISDLALLAQSFAPAEPGVSFDWSHDVMDDFEKLIMFHVVRRPIPPGMIQHRGNMTLKTEMADRWIGVEVLSMPPRVVVNQEATVIGIIECRNGFIYKTNRPLFPPFNDNTLDVMTYIRGKPEYSKLKYLMDRAESFDEWAKAGPMTILLIPDSAWKLDGVVIPPCFFKALVRPQNRELLNKLLAWITIPGLWTREDIQKEDWLPNGAAPSLSVVNINVGAHQELMERRANVEARADHIVNSEYQHVQFQNKTSQSDPERPDIVTLIEGREVVMWNIPLYNGFAHAISEIPVRPDLDLRGILWDCFDSLCSECPLVTKYLLKYLDSAGLLPDLTNPKAYIVPPGIRPQWMCQGAPSWFPPGWDLKDWRKYIEASKNGSYKQAKALAHAGWRKAAISNGELADRLWEAENHLKQIWWLYGDTSAYSLGHREDPSLLFGWLRNKRSIEALPRICDPRGNRRIGFIPDNTPAIEPDFPQGARESLTGRLDRETRRVIGMQDLRYVAQWV